MQNKVSLLPKTARPYNPSQKCDDLRSEKGFIYLTWFLFAVVLALVTRSHDVYLDEAQAWLIARQSNGLLDLCGHLHYEGHPAFWYLLIYIPAHISDNIVWLKVINYTLSLVMAWLLLSARNAPLFMRTLPIFSVYILFYMGVVERSYMLSGVLLVAASRCFLDGSRRHWLGVVFLGLAINTHLLAIPVVVGIILWFYWLAPDFTVTSALARLRETRFWGSAVIILIAIILAFLTVRPAHDIYSPQFERAGLSRLGYLALGVGYVWHQFVPYPSGWFSDATRQLLSPDNHPSALSVTLTVLLASIGLWALPTPRARWYMVSVSAMWSMAIWATVHTPSAFHCSFLFVAYLIPLIAKFPGDADGKALASSRVVLSVLLSMQILTAVMYCWLDISLPFSGSKPTADWLRNHGFNKHPLVIEPDLAAPALLAYLGVDSAYFPACQCRGSFVVFRKGREVTRHVTSSELQLIKSEYGLSPLLIVASNLGEPNYQQLGLQLLYTSPHGWFWSGENLSVYGESDVAKMYAQESSAWIPK